MIATVEYLTELFWECNKEYFDNSLPTPYIELFDSFKNIARFEYFKNKKGSKKPIKNQIIKFSKNYDFDEKIIRDIMVHEMIHYFIGFNQLEDATAHGPIFIHMMNEINSKYHRHITVSHKSTDEQKEALVDKKTHYHVVAVVAFHDGRTGIKVLPRVIPSILKYYNSVLKNKEVLAVQLYMSNNTFFNRFPNSNSLKVHFLEPEEIKQQIAGAEILECDGDSIIRNR